MKEVLAVVAAVRRRLFVNLVIGHLFDAGFYAAVTLAAAFLAAKIIFFPSAMAVLSWCALALLLGAVLYAAVAARIDLFPASLAADEKLGLAERLSTALAVQREQSAMAQAVVEDARNHAMRARLGDRFPVTLPARWWRLAAALAGVTLVLVLPQFDVLGRQAAFQRGQKEKAAVEKEVKELQKKVEQLRKAFEGKEFAAADEIEALEAQLVDLEKAGLNRKEALAALSESLEKLADKMKDAAKDLANDAQQKKNDLAKSLADQQNKLAEQAKDLSAQQQQMQNLQQQLAKMAEQMKDQQMSSEQAQQMAEALSKLAQSMPQNSQLAQQLQQMAKDLKEGNQQKAGEEAGKSLTNLQNQMAALQSKLGITQQQMAALQQQMNNMQQNQQGSDSMQMAGGDAAQQIQQMMEAMQGMESFKENLTGEQGVSMAEALEQMNQAYAQAQGMGTMPGQGGTGLGMGDKGMGRGNVWDVAPDSGDPMQKDNLPGEMKPGRVLAAYYTEGGQIKNESKVQYQEIVMESKQEAKDALTDQKVPRTYEKVVKEYFESLDAPAR